MFTISAYLIVLVSFATYAIARGNYGYGQNFAMQQNQICNNQLYQRAKEMIKLEIQQQAGNLVPSNAQFDSRYPPMTNGYQIQNQMNSSRTFLADQLNDHQCKLLRQAFDDIIVQIPLCDPIGSYSFQQSSDLANQCRQFIKTHCERNRDWTYGECFKRREILDCENQFNFMRSSVMQKDQGRSFSSSSSYQNRNSYQNRFPNYDLCRTYETFRNCVQTYTRLHCYTSDMEYLGTYLVDKAQNLAWSCLFTPGQSYNSYQSSSNPSGIDTFSPRRTDIIFTQQPGNIVYQPPPYQLSSFPSNNSYNSYNSSLSSYQQQTPGMMGQPSPSEIDRIGVGGMLNGYQAGTVSACIERVRPYESSCLDFLIQRQREARYGRSSTDVQRRICCALFRYRDCLSRVVLERCFDSSRTTIDVLMGDRNRELTQNCRDITRDQCNKAVSLSISIQLIAFSIVLITILMNSLTSFKEVF
ncbi:membrane magnesium transporter 1 [Sarcoptes scabiei]|nr:membrane magnesium transporter 1 [Sarcoptes scabiei]